jgi:hypothetical protein
MELQIVSCGVAVRRSVNIGNCISQRAMFQCWCPVLRPIGADSVEHDGKAYLNAMQALGQTC